MRRRREAAAEEVELLAPQSRAWEVEEEAEVEVELAYLLVALRKLTMMYVV